MVALHWRNTTCSRQFCCRTPHSPHDEKIVMSKVTKKMTMMMSKEILCKRGRCAQFLMSPNGLSLMSVSVTFCCFLSSFAAVLSPVADVSRQSLMSPPLSQIVPETQAAAGERGHLCCCHQHVTDVTDASPRLGCLEGIV